MAMLPEGGFARNIHSRTDRPIGEGFLGPLSRLHDRRHRANTEYHRQQPRGESPATTKNDADQDRQTGDRKTDDRNMVDGQVDVGGREESLHKQIIHEAYPSDLIRQV